MSKLKAVKKLQNHPVMVKPKQVYARHRYHAVWFILRETIAAFNLHNGFGLSASLSFYAMFALIPMILLMFFSISHWVVSSDYAIVKLAILTSNLVPKLSPNIMIEVYRATQHKAVWGVFGMVLLFWLATPLAAALRSSFYTIAAIVETPSFFRNKMKDAFGVLGILLLFFVFIFSGVLLEKLVVLLAPSAANSQWFSTLASLLLITVLTASFYRMFFPAKVEYWQILLGSFITALLWLAMRPTFNLFLSFNQAYGSMFGGMKNMFISIAWLYYTFVVFLFGTAFISTLRKRDVLLLRGLFTEMPKHKENYLAELMSRYGQTFSKDSYIFKQGDEGQDLYYLVSGNIQLIHDGKLLRDLVEGDYFGEMALLTDNPRVADALVCSEYVEVVVVSAENIETLLLGEPKVTMNFLKQMANRLHDTQKKSVV